MYFVDPQLKIIAVSEHQRALLPGETFLTCHGIGVISHFVTFKKACYNKTEGMDESLRIAEDVDLYFNLATNYFMRPQYIMVVQWPILKHKYNPVAKWTR